MPDIFSPQILAIIYAASVVSAGIVARYRGYGRRMGLLVGVTLGLLIPGLAPLAVLVLPSRRRTGHRSMPSPKSRRSP